MEGNVKVRTFTTEEKDAAVLELWEGQTALGHIVLQVPEFEDFLRAVIDVRAKLNEPVPDEIDPGARIMALADPAWRTRFPMGDGPDGILLALRHPGLGWLGFLLPRQEAAALGNSLTEMSQSPRP